MEKTGKKWKIHLFLVLVGKDYTSILYSKDNSGTSPNKLQEGVFCWL